MKPLIQTSSKLPKILGQVLAAFNVFLSRLHLLPANISPLGSYGFFGNPWLYVASIIIFDRFVGGLYSGNWFTYLGFMMYPLLGKFAKNKVKKQMLLLPLASFLFFLISNAGVWWYWYDRTPADLLLCYSLAVPFYARTLLGDMVFGYGFIALRTYQIQIRTILQTLKKNSVLPA